MKVSPAATEVVTGGEEDGEEKEREIRRIWGGVY